MNLFLLKTSEPYTMLDPKTEIRMMKAEAVFVRGVCCHKEKSYTEVTLIEGRCERSRREVQFRLHMLQGEKALSTLFL